MSKIEVKGTPSRNVLIDLPEGGGIYVLRGENGTGKTHTLNAVEALVTDGKSGAIVKDDAAEEATVSGLGLSLRLGKRLSRSGELLVQSLSGLSLTSFVDPRIKDVEAADAERVRRLVEIGGVAVELDDVLEVCGGSISTKKAAALVSEFGDKPLELVKRLKAQLQEFARDQEREAAKLAGELKVIAETHSPIQPAGGDVDALNVELGGLLQRKLTISRDREKLAGDRPAYLKAKELIGTKAEDPLAVQEEIDQIDSAIADLQTTIENARKSIERLQGSRTAVSDRLTKATAAAGAAAVVAQFEERRDATDDAASVALDNEIEVKRKAIADAQAAATWKETEDRYRQTMTAKEAAAAAAVRARKEADNVDTILTNMVGSLGFPFLFKDGRLRTKTHRGDEPFAELSFGEKWKAAISIVVGQVGPGAIIVVEQEAWEGISTANREELLAMSKSAGVWIVTAQWSDDPRVIGGVYAGGAA